MSSLLSSLPLSQLTSLPPRDLSSCLDTLVCQTGQVVFNSAPSLISPAAWLLSTLWPPQLHSKIDIFKSSAGAGVRCSELYKCKVKRVEKLFHSIVKLESKKLAGRLRERVGNNNGKYSWADLIKAVFT